MPDNPTQRSSEQDREAAREAAGAWAKRYFVSSRSLMEALLRPYGLGHQQWYVLHVLAADGPVAQRELTQALRVERATLSTIVGVLVGKGLVDQRPAPDDQRQKILHLTDTGRDLWRRIPDPLDVITAVALGDVDPEDLATTNRVLREATARLDTYREQL